jgi:LacI family transcriptional regulator
MTKNKNITLKDLSKITSLSTTTISNVLTNRGRFGEKTKKKVLEAVDRYGYRANIVARTLKSKKSSFIGVLIPSILSEYYFLVIKGMEDVAKKNGYTLLIHSYDHSIEEEIATIKKLHRLYIDGLILLGGSKRLDHLMEMTDRLPTVMVDREIEDAPFSQVNIKNKSAMKDAVNYICSLGHDDIGYVGFNFKNSIANVELRKEGFIEGLKENKKKIREENIIYRCYEDPLGFIKEFYEHIRENFGKIKDPPTALITQNDYNAIAVIKYLRDINIRVPEDISVMGFTNISMSEFIFPALSTITHPKRTMGRYSIELLINMIEKGEDRVIKKYFDSKLLVRESTAGPRTWKIDN